MKKDKSKLYPRTADRQMNAGDYRPDLKVVPATFANELEKEVDFYKWHYQTEKNKFDAVTQTYNKARQLLFSMSQALAGLFKWVMVESELFEAHTPDQDVQDNISKILIMYKEFQDQNQVSCQTCEHRGQSPISGNDCEGCHNFSNYQMKVG